MKMSIGRPLSLLLSATPALVICALYAANIWLHFGSAGLEKAALVQFHAESLLTPSRLVLTFLLLSVFIYWLAREVRSKEFTLPTASSRDVLLVVGVHALVGVFYYFLLSGSWSRLPNLYGDEDFHISSAIALKHALNAGGVAFWQTGVELPHVYRYPILHHLIVALLGSETNAFRDGILYGYIGLSALAAVLALQMPELRKAVLPLSAALLTSPLLYSYVDNHYCDGLIPPLMVIVCISVYGALSGQGRYWSVLAIASAALLPFLRYHMLPTTMVTWLVLGLAGKEMPWLNRASTTWARWIAQSAVLLPPIMIYMGLKLFYHTDAGRLSISNIPQQEFSLFLLMFVVYVPALILVLLTDRLNRNQYLFVVCSLLAQLPLMLMFDPGWIPWSRNYLAFSGQVAFLGAVAYATCDKPMLVKQAALALTILAGGAGIVSAQKNDVLFGENENRIGYDKALQYIQDNYSKDTVYFQTPLYGPYAFDGLLYGPRFAGLNARIVRINPAPATPLGEPYLLLRSLPCEARVAILHWRKSASLPLVMRNGLVMEKYNQNAGLPFKVVFEAADEHSEGRKGIMVVERVGSCDGSR